MKIINFVNPTQDKEAYDLLVECIFAGFGLQQTYQNLREIGYFVPQDQCKAFEDVCNIMIEMDLGDRVNGYDD